MFGPKNIRCRNFNDEGVGECDSGEYCRFVHPGPRWANARPYNNRGELEHIPKSYFEGGGRGGGGGGGGRGRPWGGNGGNRGPRRCRWYEPDGTPIKGGCHRHSSGGCRFTHPDQPEWDAATPSSDNAQGKGSFGFSTGSNPLFNRLGMEESNETRQSIEPSTPSLGWGQKISNEPEQPANETSGDSGGWGAGETTNADSGWGGGGSGGGGWGESNGGGWGNSNGGGWGNSSGGGWGNSSGGGGGNDNSGGSGNSGGGGWGSSGNDPNSGGGASGGWGSSNNDNNATNTAQPTTQKEASEGNPPATTSPDNAWGSSGTWGSSDNTWGSSTNAWGSSTSGTAWGSSTAEGGWGSSGSGWGNSNNTSTSSNDTAQPEPASGAGFDKGKGKELDTSVQGGGWSGWRNTSNPETTTGSLSSGGGWGNPAPSVPATVGVTQDHDHPTPRPETAPAAMDVDPSEAHFEGKAILNALGNAVQRRRNKRKRGLEEINECPRYYRHLLASHDNAYTGSDGDGDAVMGDMPGSLTREESVEAGEIIEVPPCIDYDMSVLSREPKTSEEKTTFAKHLIYIFTEAAVTMDQCKKAEKRYEDYKRSQEARIYNHPSHDARQVLVDKLQALRGASIERNERVARIIADLGALPSHHLSDVVAFNENNHVSEEALAVEQRRACIDAADRRLNEGYYHVDRNLIALQARLEGVIKEKEAREALCNLPSPVDPDELAVEEALTLQQENVQRVIAVEDALQTITNAEETPHKDGPTQVIEESLPATDYHVVQIQQFAESIAKLIQKAGAVKQDIDTIKAENGKHQEAEKEHEESVKVLDQRSVACAQQLEALNSRVTEVMEGLKHEITVENVKAAVQPALSEHTRVVLKDVQEHVERGLDGTRELIRGERVQMEAHIYSRLVGTQRLFEAVGSYLRSVRADLAKLVDKDIGVAGY